MKRMTRIDRLAMGLFVSSILFGLFWWLGPEFCQGVTWWDPPNTSGGGGW